MGFRYFYNLDKNNRMLFEEVFIKYYDKGYFGSIPKNIIREQQYSWFNKFLMLIETKDVECLISSLSNRDNICTREWFSKIFQEDILNKSREDIREIVERKLK